MENPTQPSTKLRTIRDYFIEAWMEISPPVLSSMPISFYDFKDRTEKAISIVSKKMDGAEIKYEISDHCIHHLVVFKENEEELDLALNPVTLDEVNLVALEKFIKAIGMMSRIKCGEGLRGTAQDVRLLADVFENVFRDCSRCYRAIELEEVVYSEGVATFKVRVFIGPDYDSEAGMACHFSFSCQLT